ncbi:PAS domain-containing protein [Mucilaginibacter sp. ZT4R22]|uniref:protein-glutamate O-methyltransferase n=1 Tax=Mucilaginibacter pankratovii TaxID=2772110 RepID=A0ABR7WNV9_9SPHI|nr:CheR family methyltransferase [Mucilaginibacter pankratovii]MBD1363049.1 PAS domain-containing protein [Mucilaginibacter pankratovii]
MVKARRAITPELIVKRSAGKASKPKSFPIIAIGGSAGSFTAYEKFFGTMPADSGTAIVIIMHLDPLHKSQLSEVLQRYTPMPVIEATDGVAIEPDHVYVIPSNKDMGIHNRKLLLLSASKQEGLRQPIDYFLQSLANDQWNRAVAVILSGMGSDGETGIRMIKENLGLTLAQDPNTAAYNSMPLAAIGTNLIDYVLAPEDMPLKIIQYLNHPAIAEEASDDIKISLKNNNAVQKILMLLRTHTGNDFSLYKKSTVTRRIDRRIAFNQFTDYGQYANFLADNSEETESLFNELLIGVTKFFRDAAAFESLSHHIKEIFQRKKNDDAIRVWVAGCSTGEEAYSVAMLLVESLDELKLTHASKIQVYATDLDPVALEHARVGHYHSNIVSEVSPQRLRHFFHKDEDGFRVKKELRDLIVFAQQNLVKDPPFIKLDLLCCRNMLIYFTNELQKKIIPLFYYALNPNGVMFMGPAETIGGFTDMFKSIDPKWKIFTRLEGNIRLSTMIDFPFQTGQQPKQPLKQNDMPEPNQKRSITDIFNKILIDKFLPPSVLVNEKGDILYNNGNTATYLELPRGETVVNNILKLAREELKYALSDSMQQALKSDDIIVADNVSFKDNKEQRVVSIRATAVREPGTPVQVLIVFEDQGLGNAAKNQPDINGPNDSTATTKLKKELVYTKQQLTNTVEQMEGSLERIRLSNEELQSTNEELQSTNEESLTTKEEMQSLNEELMTVNSQYQSKTEELTRLNNDMKNLLEATEVCTLFLDNDLNILRYTPQVRKLFNLIATDVGRPISHVVSNFDQPINEDDIREVIDKLCIKVTDVKTKNNEWYRIRIMPYRTLDNYISGAVLTLTLITDYKLMQSSLEVCKDYLASIVNEMPQATFQLDKSLKITSANTAASTLFGLVPHKLLGQKVDEFLKKHWKTDTPGELLQQCLFERRMGMATVIVKGKKPITYLLEVRPFFEDTVTTPLIVLSINEKPVGA